MLVAQQEGRLQLPNDNFDTGELTEPTAYPFADKAYAKLLAKVSRKPISDDVAQSTSSHFMPISGRRLRPRRTRRLGKMYSMNWAYSKTRRQLASHCNMLSDHLPVL